jgi:hypothetical protein
LGLRIDLIVARFPQPRSGEMIVTNALSFLSPQIEHEVLGSSLKKPLPEIIYNLPTNQRFGEEQEKKQAKIVKYREVF